MSRTMVLGFTTLRHRFVSVKKGVLLYHDLGPNWFRHTGNQPAPHTHTSRWLRLNINPTLEIAFQIQDSSALLGTLASAVHNVSASKYLPTQVRGLGRNHAKDGITLQISQCLAPIPHFMVRAPVCRIILAHETLIQHSLSRGSSGPHSISIDLDARAHPWPLGRFCSWC